MPWGVRASWGKAVRAKLLILCWLEVERQEGVRDQGITSKDTILGTQFSPSYPASQYSYHHLIIPLHDNIGG